MRMHDRACGMSDQVQADLRQLGFRRGLAQVRRTIARRRRCARADMSRRCPSSRSTSGGRAVARVLPGVRSTIPCNSSLKRLQRSPPVFSASPLTASSKRLPRVWNAPVSHIRKIGKIRFEYRCGIHARAVSAAASSLVSPPCAYRPTSMWPVRCDVPQFRGVQQVVVDQRAQVVGVGAETTTLAELAFVLHVDHEGRDLVVGEVGVARHDGIAGAVRAQRRRARDRIVFGGDYAQLHDPAVHRVGHPVVVSAARQNRRGPSPRPMSSAR